MHHHEPKDITPAIFNQKWTEGEQIINNLGFTYDTVKLKTISLDPQHESVLKSIFSYLGQLKRKQDALTDQQNKNTQDITDLTQKQNVLSQKEISNSQDITNLTHKQASNTRDITDLKQKQNILSQKETSNTQDITDLMKKQAVITNETTDLARQQAETMQNLGDLSLELKEIAKQQELNNKDISVLTQRCTSIANEVQFLKEDLNERHTMNTSKNGLNFNRGKNTVVVKFNF